MSQQDLKKELRTSILRKRDALPGDERTTLSTLIIGKLKQSNSFLKAKTVFCYVSFRSEVDTLELIEFLTRSDKRVCVPYVKNRGGVMEAREITDLDDLVKGEYGIRTVSPVSSQMIAPGETDLVITPGAVFDRAGNRIGYGAGYYDRFFRQLNKQSRKTALAYDFQVVRNVPHETHDIPVDEIITEKEHYITKNELPSKTTQ